MNNKISVIFFKDYVDEWSKSLGTRGSDSFFDINSFSGLVFAIKILEKMNPLLEHYFEQLTLLV